jgi:hypothetical protein
MVPRDINPHAVAGWQQPSLINEAREARLNFTPLLCQIACVAEGLSGLAISSGLDSWHLIQSLSLSLARLFARSVTAFCGSGHGLLISPGAVINS